MKRAEIGNVIEFREGLQGIVEKVNENSVIVDLTYMDNFRDLEMDTRTVVNHKNYKIVKESIIWIFYFLQKESFVYITAAILFFCPSIHKATYAQVKAKNIHKLLREILLKPKKFVSFRPFLTFLV